VKNTDIIIVLILLWLFKDELAALSGGGKKAGQGAFTLGCMLAILALVLLLAGGLGGIAGG